MRMACPEAQIAIHHAGGIRRDLPVGDVTYYDVAELLPFGNSLVIIELTGRELKEALEEHIDFLWRRWGKNPDHLPSISGMTMTVLLTAPPGARISALCVAEGTGTYLLLREEQRYQVVVNAFMAAGVMVSPVCGRQRGTERRICLTVTPSLPT